MTAIKTKNDVVTQKESRPSTVKVWILASRPHTLTASISPVLVGHNLCKSVFCNHEGVWKYTWQWLLFCVLVQLGTNLHNDYADFVKGADTKDRVGQARATQKGWLSPSQTCRGSDVCLISALSIGLRLALFNGKWDWFMVGIVLTSVFNAVAYTGGPYPLGYVGLGNLSIGYSGLGDIFVFLYFGLVAALVLPYLCDREVSSSSSTSGAFGPCFLSAFPVALPVGWLGTAIIVVNNLRDRHTDVSANKKTLAVRFGATFCRIEYALLVLGPYASVPFLLSSLHPRHVQCLPLLSLPMIIPQLKAVSLAEKDGADLNPHVGGTARVQFAFCILLSMALRLGGGGDA